MSNSETMTDYHQRFDRISSKRKLDDYGPSDDDLSDLLSVRFKKDELLLQQQQAGTLSVNFNSNSNSSPNWQQQQQHQLTHNTDDVQRILDSQSVSCSDNSMPQSTKTLHFFVRISGRNTLVIHANSDDSIKSLHQHLQTLTGIPLADQRLNYRGKLLQWDKTLADYSIENDAGLQLVSPMRSSKFPKTWQVINDLVSSICILCRGETENSSYFKIVKSRVREFLKMIPKDDTESSLGHIQIFKSACAPSALVMLFLSPISGNKDCAEESIRLFLYPNMSLSTKAVQNLCAPIVLELCKLLSRTARDDPLYVLCRNSLGTMLDSIGNVHSSKFFEHGKASFVIHEIFPFIRELEDRLSTNLEADSFCCTATSLGEVRNFAAFLHPLRLAIVDQVGGNEHLPIDLQEERPCYVLEIGALHAVFLNLLGKIDECLRKVEEILIAKGAEEIEEYQLGWSQYLSILKQLNSVSTLYRGAEEKISSVMRTRRIPLNALVRHAKRSDDHTWFLKHKDVTNFESRRHLVMLMLPEVKDDYEELHEMLIDRSNLLSESFEYIARAEPDALHGGLFMEFKNEEATGPGVLREWFCLVCQAIFNPQNPLFLTCPNDHRRFFPNPASCMESLHLDYFGFCGRLIALALMHKVHIGVVFDRVFFLQLAGKFVSLEDVRDADPCLYMSCKRILEMDADFLDSDALGLTFVREIEELGSRRTVELCPGGKTITLNSKNREEYVNLLIQHHFVTSVSQQVARFAEGFGDILCDSRSQKFFFQSLELEDFDRMLYGNNRAICIKDWMAHTEYNGYKESDSQICWFWKIVEGMPAEQQRALLFFWTSVKYLPMEGFGGLQSVLYIYKASDSTVHLPTSHTCFYRLCLPAYPSIDVMRYRLQTITQEHVSCSFGTW